MGRDTDEITVQAHDLERLVSRILVAAGTPDDIAGQVADCLVMSNLRGADSHGVLQLSGYVDEIQAATIDPAARPEIVIDLPGLTLLNGHQGLGTYMLWRAGEIAVEKAKRNGAATVALRNCGHTGRLGHVIEHIASNGCFAQIMGGGAREKWPVVAPHGGRERVLSTNPYAFGVPSGGNENGPVVTDFATSVISDGKIQACHASGLDLAKGCIIDKDGNPSTDPKDYFDGGAHLPAAGHKGYGMALVSELACGIALESAPDFGWFVIAVDLETIGLREGYRKEASELLLSLRNSAPAAGHSNVSIPGERGTLLREHKLEHGISLPAPVVENLRMLVQRLSLKVSSSLNILD